MNYDAQRAAALRMIRKAGAEATIHRSASVYDPLSQQTTTTETTFVTPCVVLPIGRNDVGFGDLSLAAEESAKVLVPAGVEPRSGDGVTLPGDPARWSIIDVKPLRPDGQRIMSTFIARRGG